MLLLLTNLQPVYLVLQTHSGEACLFGQHALQREAVAQTGVHTFSIPTQPSRKGGGGGMERQTGMERRGGKGVMEGKGKGMGVGKGREHEGGATKNDGLWSVPTTGT